MITIFLSMSKGMTSCLVQSNAAQSVVPSREQAELAANTISQSMYAHCDPDGNQYVMFDSIVDFRRSTTALCYADQKVLKADERSFMRRTTAGWHPCVQ